MKTGVDTCQARRIHKLHTKLLWTSMDQLDVCEVDPRVATVSQLTEISEPEDWVTVTPPGCLGCIGIELPRPPSERNYMPSTSCSFLHIRSWRRPQVRSLTSPRFQASRSRNWLEQIAHAATNRHSSQEQSVQSHEVRIQGFKLVSIAPFSVEYLT